MMMMMKVDRFSSEPPPRSPATALGRGDGRDVVGAGVGAGVGVRVVVGAGVGSGVGWHVPPSEPLLP